VSTAFVCDDPGCGDLTHDLTEAGWLLIRWYTSQPAEILHFCSWRCLRRYGKRANQ
jgi:hypothetical protein